jgi:restriction system protein
LSGDFDPEVARLGYSPALATNINLGALLTKHFDIALKEVFATNLFPFIKRGNLNAGIPANLMQYAATKFCLPQIEIVKPKLVICMGIATFNAIRRVKSLKSVDNLQDGFEQPIVEADKEYWCQSHPGALGRINRESKGRTGQVNRDWAQMAERFRQV